ncbi:MAG: glycerol acyltransferase [Pedobacter sp.]|nr:MAG: glycerol acyltransferase [Pedobacter sp.]
MHRPRKSFLVFKLFSWYLDRIIKKDFSGYSFNYPEVKKTEAILMLANHFSWWDGFLLFHLNKKVFKKDFHVLVTDEDYKKHWFLKYLGAFAAEKKGKDVLETLAHAGELLDEPGNLVLIFPQGKLYGTYVSGISFEKGVMQVINASKKKFQIVFSATLINHSTRKPLLKTCLQSWEAEEYISLQLLKSEYNKHYTQCVRHQNSLA